MRFTHLLCCAVLALPGTAGANELLRVYDLAVTNDAALQAARHQRDAAIEARPQALALLLPNIDGRYGTTNSEDSGVSSFTGLAPLDPTDPNSPLVPRTQTQVADTQFDASQLTVTLNQPLFNWELFQNFSRSGDQVALAETTYRAAQQNLVLRVAAAYFDVLAAADAVRSSQAEMKAVGRQQEQSQKRFEVGLSAITDVQEARARYDLTVAQEIAARQALESAKEALAVITGTPTVSFVPLQEDIPLPAPNPADVTSWVGAAADSNLDLLASRHVAEIAGKGVDVAWARHLPTLGGQYQYQKSDSDGSRFGGPFADDTANRSYGFLVTIPIFDGLGRWSVVRQARATREQREAEYEYNRRIVERQTRDAYQGVISGAARVKALRQAVLSNTTALEASETGLQVGARTAVDVLNAEQLLYLAQRDYYRARYDYLISVLSLKAAAGRLSAQDLAEVDRLLVAGAVAVPPPVAPPSEVPPDTPPSPVLEPG